VGVAVDQSHGHVAELDCCPELVGHECCDRLDFKYTLKHPVRVAGARLPVTVLVTLHFRFERCPGPFTLGDLVYTTTLLPGEKVRLVTTDRRSRFLYDAQTKLSYRHSEMSEEHYFMASFAHELTDLNVDENGSAQAHSWGDWHGSADSSYATAVFVGGGQGSIEGGYDDQSTRDFARSLSRHAESSQNRSVIATRTASSVSIGEVSSRSHAEGETEDHFESASRVFENANHCHALSFFFYRIDRIQTVRFKLVRIERQIDDPVAPTHVASNPLPPFTGVSVMPDDVKATAENRQEVEERGIRSAAAAMSARTVQSRGLTTAGRLGLTIEIEQPISAAVRKKALEQVDNGLVTAGLLEAVGGDAGTQAVEELSWESESCLPTAGIIVKGCLDECDVCEPDVHRAIELDLDRKQLENELLKKQIELLEKSQEYRCCPKGEEEPETP
jgi:hypothetical protein